MLSFGSCSDFGLSIGFEDEVPIVLVFGFGGCALSLVFIDRGPDGWDDFFLSLLVMVFLKGGRCCDLVRRLPSRSAYKWQPGSVDDEETVVPQFTKPQRSGRQLYILLLPPRMDYFSTSSEPTSTANPSYHVPPRLLEIVSKNFSLGSLSRSHLPALGVSTAQGPTRHVYHKCVSRNLLGWITGSIFFDDTSL